MRNILRIIVVLLALGAAVQTFAHSLDSTTNLAGEGHESPGG